MHLIFITTVKFLKAQISEFSKKDKRRNILIKFSHIHFSKILWLRK